MKGFEHMSQSDQRWRCPACKELFSQRTKRRRHLLHCQSIKEEFKAGTPATDIQQIIDTNLKRITKRKKARCICEAGYRFCENIVDDINEDADLFLVSVRVGNRTLKYIRYSSFTIFLFLSSREEDVAFLNLRFFHL